MRSFNHTLNLVLMEDKGIQQRWLRLKIAQKCLEILLLLYNLHIFASNQIKEESNNFFLIFGGRQFLSNVFWSNF